MDLFIIFLFLTGLFIGSFLGVLVDRIPTGRSVVKGRSKCEYCKHDLGALDLIPIFSFLFLRGRCRYCKHKLSGFYPTIEFTTGFLFASTYLIIVPHIINSVEEVVNLLFYFSLISGFIVVFFTDLKHGIIPDKIVFPSIFASALWLLIYHQSQILPNLLSAFGASLFLILIATVYYFLRKKESMGGGDIKFVFLMGIVLGFPNIIVAFYIAFLTAAFYSIILILWGKLTLKNTIPFGPFLVLGTLLTLFFSNQILSLVFPYFGL